MDVAGRNLQQTQLILGQVTGTRLFDVPGVKTVVMLGRRGVGISTLTRDMVWEAVSCCTDCTQLAWSRRCCARCSERLMGVMNPEPLRLPPEQVGQPNPDQTSVQVATTQLFHALGVIH
jgi:hypothetical protein